MRLRLGQRRFRSQRRLRAMPQSVDEADRPEAIVAPPGVGVAASIAPVHRPAQALDHHGRHILATILVPTPTWESIENSSINLRAPGSPPPSPLLVEYPSCIANSISGMPGPWSLATISIPTRSRSSMRTIRIVPPG